MSDNQKFWMLWGPAGTPVARFHSYATAVIRAQQIAAQSGNDVVLLEAVEVCTVVRCQQVDLEWRATVSPNSDPINRSQS